MRNGRVRWGVLGAAKIADEWLNPAIHLSGRGGLAAMASRDEARAAVMAAPYGARAVAGYGALLADPEIDAIYIPLPNSDHVPWTLRCLEAGKHVLCEKPIALEAGEIDRLIAARDRTGLVVGEAFMVVHHPQWHRVREIVSGGGIGRLRHVQGAFSFFNDDPGNIRNKADLGGGALRDIGVYPSVTTRFVTGAEPDTVSAEIDFEAGIDATARVWARFADFHMDFYVSMRMAPRQLMTFHGTQGWVSVHAGFNAGLYGDAEIEVRTGDAVRVLERFPCADQYRAQIDAFNAAVLDGVPFPCSLEFSRGNQRMIDMIYRAAGAPS